MTKKVPSTPPQKPSVSTSKRVFILSGAIVLLVVGMLSGVLPFAAAAVSCLKAPVIASKFAASYSYILPGEEGYGPDMFGKSYYCTQAQAEAAGYQHSPLTSGGRAEERQRLEAEELAATKPLDFTLYSPTDPQYVYKYADIARARPGNVSSDFFSAKLFHDEKEIGTILMRKMGTERSLCDPVYYECAVIGTDSQGRQVKKVTKSKNNVGSRNIIGVQIENTSIVVFSDAELAEQDVITFFGSLQPDTRPLDQW
jgi:hypothetical protein